MNEYEILKCDFHVHYYESYKQDAHIMVDAFAEHGYDCIALAEHNTVTNLDGVKRMVDYCREKYGDSLLIIVGEEIENWGARKTDHLLALFLNEYVTVADSLEETIDRIHAQEGIAILAHDAWSNYDMPDEKWHWASRDKYNLDGWEIANGSGHTRNLSSGKDYTFSHPQETIDEGYIFLSNSDAHTVEQIPSRGKCHNYVFVKERSTAGVKDALLQRRIVCNCNDKIYGYPKYVEMYKKRTRV